MSKLVLSIACAALLCGVCGEFVWLKLLVWRHPLGSKPVFVMQHHVLCRIEAYCKLRCVSHALSYKDL